MSADGNTFKGAAAQILLFPDLPLDSFLSLVSNILYSTSVMLLTFVPLSFYSIQRDILLYTTQKHPHFLTISRLLCEGARTVQNVDVHWAHSKT